MKIPAGFGGKKVVFTLEINHSWICRFAPGWGIQTKPVTQVHWVTYGSLTLLSLRISKKCANQQDKDQKCFGWFFHS